MKARRLLLLGFLGSLSFMLLSSELRGSFEENLFVTVEDYACFLNHVAAADPHHLYQTADKKGSSSEEPIMRFGELGNYHYDFFPERAQQAMPLLNAWDAMRFYHWKKNSAALSGKSDDVDLLAEQDPDELASNQLIAVNDDGIYLCSQDNPAVALSTIDPLLHSSEVSACLRLQNSLLQKSAGTKENFTWDGMRVFISALITIGTLFGEGHFSLEEARRSAPPGPEIDYSENPRIESKCYSSDAVLENLKNVDPATRFEAEKNLLEKRTFPHEVSEKKPYLEESLLKERIARAAMLEAAFQDASQRTFLGELDETRKHLGSGIGHLAGWVLYTLSPVLDNGRRITAGGVIGYGAGAAVNYLLHGSFFGLMSDGDLGAYIGIVAFSFNNLRDMYQHGADYREAFRERYQEMKKSFSEASQSFCKAWKLDEITAIAAQARRDFYQQELLEYSAHLQRLSENEAENATCTFAPEYTRLLLEAQAHEVINASQENKESTFAKFIEMGENFYGKEMMDYALPLESHEEALSDFDAVKNVALAKIRCASTSLVRQWQKLPENLPENFHRDLIKIKASLEKQLDEIEAAPEASKKEALEHCLQQGKQFYGEEIMNEFLSLNAQENFLANFQDQKNRLLAKVHRIEIPISLEQWQKGLEASRKDFESIKKQLEEQLSFITMAPEEKKLEGFNQFKMIAENFYGKTILEYLFPQINATSLPENVSKRMTLLFQQLKMIHRSQLNQHEKLLEESKKNPETIHDILPKLDPITRFEFLKNHADELRGYASNELEKLKTENEKGFLKDSLEASCGLACHAASLSFKIIGISLIGFFTGSFIGHEIPITFSSHDLYHPWVEANSMGIAYAGYFGFVGSMSQNTIRTSARATTAAYAELCDIWNRPQRQKEAQAKINLAERDYQRALNKFLKENPQQALDKTSLNTTLDNSLKKNSHSRLVNESHETNTDQLGFKFPSHNSIRDSWMPNFGKKLLNLRDSLGTSCNPMRLPLEGSSATQSSSEKAEKDHLNENEN